MKTGNSTMKGDIILQVFGNVGVITLNNVKNLNSISTCTCECIQMALKAWRNKMKLVIIRAEGPIFSSGGDLIKASLYMKRFNCYYHYCTVYAKTIEMISQFPGYVITFVNGPAVGFAVSIIHASTLSVIQDNSWLSKPESSVGLSIDYGSSYIFSRLPSSLGTYLALTGKRISASDSSLLGIAGPVLSKDKFCELQESLLTLQNPTEHNIQATIDRYRTLNVKQDLELLEENIEKHFSKPTVQKILESLDSDSSEWSQDTLNHLRKLNPVSLLVTNHIMQVARDKSYSECVYLETVAFSRMMNHQNFLIGAEAVLRRKGETPKWSYARVEDVPQEVIQKICGQSSPEEEKVFKILKEDIWTEETSVLFTDFEQARKDLEEMKSRIGLDSCKL